MSEVNKDTNFLDNLKNKRIRIVQKDTFIKSGLCRGYDERFLFLEFNDGSDIAISLDNIIEIKVLEAEKYE